MNGFGAYEPDERGRPCYRPPVPSLPRIDDVWEPLQRATQAVADFDRALSAFPAPAVVGRLFARLDAVRSSGAEGSTTTFTDLLEYETALRRAADPEDTQSVAGCAEAFDLLGGAGDMPLDDVARTIHRRLFENSRDPMVSSSAGQWKRLANSTFDPDLGGAFHYTRPGSLSAALAEWDAFTSTRDTYPALVRAALSHWMFEHIHPFTDGNGRVGRLLIPLVLRWQGTTANACAFLGESVHENKQLYIDALKAGRRNGDLAPWSRVCLALITQASQANLERLAKLGGILARWRGATSSFRSHGVIHDLVPYALTKPVFTVRDALADLGKGTFQTINAAAGKLVDLGIVHVPGKSQRDRLFAAREVLALFELNAPPPRGLSPTTFR